MPLLEDISRSFSAGYRGEEGTGLEFNVLNVLSAIAGIGGRYATSFAAKSVRRCRQSPPKIVFSRLLMA